MSGLFNGEGVKMGEGLWLYGYMGYSGPGRSLMTPDNELIQRIFFAFGFDVYGTIGLIFHQTFDVVLIGHFLGGIAEAYVMYSSRNGDVASFIHDYRVSRFCIMDSIR